MGVWFCHADDLHDLVVGAYNIFNPLLRLWIDDATLLIVLASRLTRIIFARAFHDIIVRRTALELQVRWNEPPVLWGDIRGTILTSAMDVNGPNLPMMTSTTQSWYLGMKTRLELVMSKYWLQDNALIGR